MHMTQMRTKILHHHIHFAFDTIDQQSHALAVSTDQHYGSLFIRLALWKSKQLPKRIQGVEIILYDNSRTPTICRVLEVIEATNRLNHHRRYCKLVITD